MEKRLTKKEKRELKKLEKQKGKEQEKRRKFIKKIATWTTAILLSLGFLYAFANYISQKSESQKASLKLRNDDWEKGSPGKEVVIVEYSDFQCPACASYYPIVKNLIEQSDQVTFVYRHFPLSQVHQNARIAAYAAEAAGRQDNFWQMHDKLFENQSQWADSKNPEEEFIEYAKELQLDVDKFENDLESEEVKSKVERDYQSGLSSGVNATPTFFLNGTKLTNIRSLQDFQKKIEESLQE